MSNLSKALITSVVVVIAVLSIAYVLQPDQSIAPKLTVHENMNDKGLVKSLMLTTNQPIKSSALVYDKGCDVSLEITGTHSALLMVSFEHNICQAELSFDASGMLLVDVH